MKTLVIFLVLLPLLLFGQSNKDSLFLQNKVIIDNQVKELKDKFEVDTIFGILDQNGSGLLIWKKNNKLFYSVNNDRKKREKRRRISKYFNNSISFFYDSDFHFDEYTCPDEIRRCENLTVLLYENKNPPKGLNFFIPKDWKNTPISNFVLIYNNLIY